MHPKLLKLQRLADARARRTLPWIEHTPIHWSITVCGEKFHYWPTTGYCRYYTLGKYGDIATVEHWVRCEQA